MFIFNLITFFLLFLWTFYTIRLDEKHHSSAISCSITIWIYYIIRVMATIYNTINLRTFYCFILYDIWYAAPLFRSGPRPFLIHSNVRWYSCRKLTTSLTDITGSNLRTNLILSVCVCVLKCHIKTSCIVLSQYIAFSNFYLLFINSKRRIFDWTMHMYHKNTLLEDITTKTCEFRNKWNLLRDKSNSIVYVIINKN